MTFEWGRLRKRIFDPIKKIWNFCGALFSCSSYQETVLFIIIKKSLFWLMSRLFRWKLILTEKWILLPRKQKWKNEKTQKSGGWTRCRHKQLTRSFSKCVGKLSRYIFKKQAYWESTSCSNNNKKAHKNASNKKCCRGSDAKINGSSRCTYERIIMRKVWLGQGL